MLRDHSTASRRRWIGGATTLVVFALIGVGCATKPTQTASGPTTQPVIVHPVTTTAPSNTVAAETAAQADVITPAETKRLLDAKADFLLIDCRTPLEVAAGKIEGSTAIPLQDLEKHQAELAPWKDKQVIVYCRTGNRSGKFVQALKEKGFTNVRNMTGGITSWKEEDLGAITQ